MECNCLITGHQGENGDDGEKHFEHFVDLDCFSQSRKWSCFCSKKQNSHKNL